MKKDIHPQYFENATITCACGTTLTLGSTVESKEVDVCRSCHPFFSGDTSTKKVTGQVEKFKARLAKKTAK